MEKPGSLRAFGCQPELDPAKHGTVVSVAMGKGPAICLAGKLALSRHSMGLSDPPQLVNEGPFHKPLIVRHVGTALQVMLQHPEIAFRLLHTVGIFIPVSRVEPDNGVNPVYIVYGMLACQPQGKVEILAAPEPGIPAPPTSFRAVFRITNVLG